MFFVGFKKAYIRVLYLFVLPVKHIAESDLYN